MNLLLKLFLTFKVVKNIYIIILYKLKIIRGDIKLKLKNGLQVILRSNDEDFSEIIVVLSGYEYEIKYNFKKNKLTIFDLGANIGAFTIYTHSKLKNYIKQYHIFEPDYKNYLYLKNNILLNKISNVNVINCAVSDFNGSSYLKTLGKKTDEYCLSNDKENGNTKCRVVSLTNYCNKYNINLIDILKMDIEGSEYNILTNKQEYNYIKKYVVYFMVEFHKNYRKEKIIKKLSKDFIWIDKKRSTYYFLNKNYFNE